MTFGLRLTGTARDLAAVRTLVDASAALLDAPWMAVSADDAAAEYAVFCPRLAQAQATELAARGLDVVRLNAVGEQCALEPLREGLARTVWKRAAARNAPNLVEALRPARVAGDPVVEEACLWTSPETPGAHKTLERLLALGRDDVAVSEWTEEGARAFLFHAQRPPMYLLMRAREEPSEGVTAFARAGGEGALWVEWGYEHPLAHLAARALATAGRAAFVDARGRWRYAPATFPTRSIFDAVTPRFDAARAELRPAAGETRFTVRLHLAGAPEAIAELWLLSPAQFFALETLVENSTPDELARFTVARLTDGGGVRYLLREMVRPSVPRLGLRVSDLLGQRGFVRAVGTDNLFLPAGRRLMPVMRRDELRALLGLDEAHFVVVDEDPDGPRIVAVTSVDEVPLNRWVEYVATDRRLELDRLLEDTVFELPEVVVEKPVRKETRDRKDRDDEDAPKPPRTEPARKRPQPVAPAAQEQEAASEAPAEVDVALREQLRALEQQVAQGGCADAERWAALARLEERVGALDEASACAEAALFHGETRAAGGLVAQLVQARARRAGGKQTTEELLDLAVRAELTPAEASYLGAAVLQRALEGDRELSTLVQQVVKVFSDPALPVSRRLAWLVLDACHRRADDKLGMTRAKERLLGGINDRGLSESHDLPSFVRFALALDEGGSTVAVERTRAEQLAVLETLWERALRLVPEAPKSSDRFHVLRDYLRALFAVGFARLGAGARARDLVTPVENELLVHQVPNQVLLRLYLARVAHVATHGTAEAWAQQVDAVLGAAVAQSKDARLKDRVEWLRKRSPWLRTATPEAPRPHVRGEIERLLAGAEGDPARLPEVLAQVAQMPKRLDYELASAIERAVGAALRSGNDDVIHDVVGAAQRGIKSLQILGHRAHSLGVCIRAAATVGDGAALDALLDEVIAVASAPEPPSMRDLLAAVGPALAALRRLGVGPAAERLLDALLAVQQPGARERVALQAALADGFLQLRDEPRAAGLLDEAIRELVIAPIDHVGRYEGGVAILAAVEHWPVPARAVRCGALLDSVDAFRDTFTVGQYYETHKVLLLERLVDAVTDDLTFRSDRVQGYLDAEEQVIRRRVIADWREVCGR